MGEEYEALLYGAGNGYSGSVGRWGYTPKTQSGAGFTTLNGESDSAKTAQLLQTFDQNAVGKQMSMGNWSHRRPLAGIVPLVSPMPMVVPLLAGVFRGLVQPVP